MQDFQDSFVGCLCLTVTLGIIYRGPMLCDFELLAKLLEILVFKLSSIISDDGRRYTILADDVISDKKSYSFAISH